MSILDKIKSLFGGGKSSGTQKSSSSGYEGVIKKFHYKKGFGFIKSSELDSEVFVHHTDADFKIREGNKVRFKIQDTDKGPRAVEVTFLAKGKPPQRRRKSNRDSR
ncbi:MAG: cold shock domain-containing protein [Saprospiraceae bacterium]|nr:cold shock domain-containing protein [Saprospiraceae bacterium]